MDLSELTDDELLAEVDRAQQAIETALVHLDDVFVEGSKRKTLANIKLAERAGINERTFYKALDRAWKRANS